MIPVSVDSSQRGTGGRSRDAQKCGNQVKTPHEQRVATPQRPMFPRLSTARSGLLPTFSRS